MEIFEVPVVVVKGDEGGEGGTELGEEGEAGDKAVKAGVGLAEVADGLGAVVVARSARMRASRASSSRAVFGPRLA